MIFKRKQQTKQEKLFDIVSSYDRGFQAGVMYAEKTKNKSSHRSEYGEIDVNVQSFEQIVKSYGFIDTKEVYTNGSMLIPVFRVEQFLEYLKSKMK